MKKLKAYTLKRDDLTHKMIADMYALYTRYYDATNYEQFISDLESKHYVVLLINDMQELRGFTTLEYYQITFQGTDHCIIYSGDTIIDHHDWGYKAFPLEWCKMAGSLKALHPTKPLHWFLISKGHRTYRYLHAFAKNYYPCKKGSTLPATKALMDYLATRKFGENYQPQKGIITFKTPHGHIKPQWDDTSKYRVKNPEVEHFLSLNPDYAKGHELVCLVELAEDNFRSFGLDHFRKGLYAGPLE